MKGLWMVALVTLVLAGCGSTQINYSPKPNPGMTRAQAGSVVEQTFYESWGKKRPESVVITDEYLLLSDGIVSKSSGVASSAPIGGGAVAFGSSSTITKAAGQRIYWRSLGQITIHQRRGRTNRYTLVIRRADGLDTRHVGVASMESAERFIDAMQVLKTTAR